MAKKILRVGIAPLDEIKKRTQDIARGRYKPKSTEPKVWFTSHKALANILSEENSALLRLIREEHPQSITELAELSGRKQSNLTRSLKSLAKYGFVELHERKQERGRPKIIPTVSVEKVSIESFI